MDFITAFKEWLLCKSDSEDSNSEDSAELNKVGKNMAYKWLESARKTDFVQPPRKDGFQINRKSLLTMPIRLEEPPPPVECKKYGPPTRPIKGINYGLGQLHFRIQYEVQHETLKVLVICGMHLAARDPRGTSDPYVILFFNPGNRKQTFKTSIKMKNLHPHWNELFVFKNVKNSSLKRTTLCFKVFDWDKWSADDVIGEAEFPLQKLYKPLLEKRKFDFFEVVKKGLLNKDMLRAQIEKEKVQESPTIPRDGGGLSNLCPDVINHGEELQPPALGSHLSIEMNDDLDHVQESSLVRNWLRHVRPPSQLNANEEYNGDRISPMNSEDERELDDSVSMRDPSPRRKKEHHEEDDAQDNEDEHLDKTQVCEQLSETFSEEDLLTIEERPNLLRRMEVWTYLKSEVNTRPTYGEILVALVYLPHFTKLVVQVIKARNVRDTDGSCMDVFVTVTRRILETTHERKFGQHRSACLCGINDPVWNEQFGFTVYPEDLEHTVIDLKVTRSTSVNISDKTLGRIRFGVKTHPIQRAQWQKMMRKQNVPVSSWHVIRN